MSKVRTILGATSAITMALVGMTLPASAAPHPKAGLTSCVISTSYKVNGQTPGWAPTNLFGNWVGGPLTTTYSQSISATQSYSYTGTVSISAQALGVEASASYATSYIVTSDKSSTWSYSANVPAGKTGRLLLLHRMDKINFTKYVDNSNCTTTSYPGLVAYLPIADTSASSYCWILDITPAKTDWKTTCTD
jgi:hypothetical protein